MMTMKAAATGCQFRPAQCVSQSGIYRVQHRDEHRSEHDIVLLAGQPFPYCAQCDGDVRFELLRTAPHLEEDVDFRTTQPTTLRDDAAKHHHDEI